MSNTQTASIIGTYHAVTYRDPSSLEYDGQGFIEINRLSSQTGEDVFEVGFADGMWLLAKAADVKLA